MRIRKCPECKKYTLKSECSCKSKTIEASYKFRILGGKLSMLAIKEYVDKKTGKKN